MRNKYYCEIKTTPRGYKGYNGIYVRLYVNGQLAGSCGGGGYDMVGKVFSQWLNKNFNKRLRELAKKEIEEMKKNKKITYNNRGGGIYGLVVCKEKNKINVYVDGTTGKSQVFKIIEAMNGKIEQLRNKRGEWQNKFLITL
ncbi:MAG: hypothetical protein QXY47_05410 [Thermoplasmata archaeon]